MQTDSFFKYFLLKLRRFCGFICGFVFFLSGIFKLMDPVGAGLVIDSYLNFLHLEFLGPLSKGLGITFALVETTLGTALITGVWRKITAIAILSLQGFFTILTSILVIFNPNMDCGCFGEVIHLSHSETLIKNIILCILLCAAFIPLKNLGRPKKRKYASFSIVCISSLAFAIYSLLHIPMTDFTEYKPGAAIFSASEQSLTEDAFEAVFIYEKDGHQKEFTLESLPDSTWTFVETKTTQKADISSKGPVLSFYDENDNYMDMILNQENIMILSVYDTDIKQKKWDRIIESAKTSHDCGFTTFILTASTPEEMTEFQINDVPVYFCDYKTLISLNRSNGGATWFSQGHLIKKWSFRNFPDEQSLKQSKESNITEIIIENDAEGSLIFQGFLLYVFAVMLLL